MIGSSTPSDYRAFDRLLADLRRHGFRFEDDGPPLRATRRMAKATHGPIDTLSRAAKAKVTPSAAPTQRTEMTTKDGAPMNTPMNARTHTISTQHDAAPLVGPRLRFSHALRREREHTGLSQGEVGRLIGVSYVTISFWERGRAAPRPETLSTLFAHFPGLRNAAEPGIERVRQRAVPTLRVSRRETSVAPPATPVRSHEHVEAPTMLTALRLARRIASSDVAVDVRRLLEIARADGCSVEDLQEILAVRGAA